jgi:hypothetical protein
LTRSSVPTSAPLARAAVVDDDDLVGRGAALGRLHREANSIRQILGLVEARPLSASGARSRSKAGETAVLAVALMTRAT